MREKLLFVDMLTGQVQETDIFSRVVRFKGSGSSSTSTTTIDYAYNARMAAVAEQEQAMANEYFTFYKSDYQPMERAQIAANVDLIPGQTAAEKAKVGLEQKTAEAQTSLIPAQTEVQAGILQNKKVENAAAAPVMSEYYKQALSGIDPNKKVAEARSDVAGAFSQGDDALRREAGRMGIDPNSSRFTEAMAGRGLQQAKATAGAMGAARSGAEATNFDRLKNATSTYKGGLGG